MKKIISAAACLLLTFFSITSHAQEDPMKAWQDFMTPGAMHKWLASHVGTWESEVQMWMDPAAPPTKSASTDVVTMSMNGLFQIGHFTSTMMGMPFQGQSTLGYDNAKKKFVLSWIDTFSSGMVIMNGDYDPATKTLSLSGVQTDPVTGKDSPIRQVNVYHDENSYTSSMYGAGPDGKEMKFMEGTYKRKKQ
ncbi:MAG TPA: DUF1579 domain-containing protein [Chitinophagaceae bacterium]|nr:DUF1579 domain-containing protein [Chitinophagaceae bacterium]HPH32930.1 DUF1579 domain-containing protein [Chitinophagaceae bacterium]